MRSERLGDSIPVTSNNSLLSCPSLKINREGLTTSSKSSTIRGCSWFSLFKIFCLSKLGTSEG